MLAAIHGRGWRRKVGPQGRVGGILIARHLLESHIKIKAQAEAGRRRGKR